MTLGIGRLPPKAYTLFIASMPEYILGMDVLKGLTIATAQCKFHLRVHVVKTTTRGHLRHAAVTLPNPRRVAVLPLREHEEIRQRVLQLEKAKIIRPMHSPYNAPIWPVKNPDGTWRMTMD